MQLVFPSLLAFVAFVAAQGGLTVNTPAAVVQCQPAQLTWTASNPPVFLSIIPGGQPGAAALQDFGQQTGTSYTWNVNIAAGTQITVQVRDNTGAVAYSAPITIQQSSDSSCLGQQPSTSAAGSSSGSAPAETSSAAATTSAAVSSASSVSTSIEASTSSVIASVSSSVASLTRPTSTAPSTSRSAAATTTSPSASASPNAARSNAQVGFAGLLGLVAAAFMA